MATGTGGASVPTPSGNVYRGIACVLLSTLFLASMHASVRYVSGTIHPFEIALFRNVFSIVVVIPWFVRYGMTPLHTARLGTHGLRALLNVGAMLLFFYGLSITPLTTATALAFSSPIMASVLAVFILKEAVDVKRWLAILFGFAGVFVILRPGFEDVGFGPFIVFSAAAVWAVALLVIKSLSRTETSVTISAYSSVLMAPMTLIPALFVWQWPTLAEFGWLVFIGVSGGAGQLLIAQALRDGDTGVVMPFDFFKLIWVAIIAFVAFGEQPDLLTWIGGAMIFAGGIQIANRERRPSVRTIKPPTPAE